MNELYGNPDSFKQIYINSLWSQQTERVRSCELLLSKLGQNMYNSTNAITLSTIVECNQKKLLRRYRPCF